MNFSLPPNWVRAFRRLADTAAARDDCPPADRLFALVAHECDTDEATRLADHLAVCPVCREAVSIAVQLERGPAANSRPEPRPRKAHWGLNVGGLTLLAAGLAALFFVPARNHRPLGPGDDSGVERGDSNHGFSRLGPDQQPRDAFELEWTSGPEGATYDVRVMNESLEVLADAYEQTEPRWTVPASALAELPEGAVVYWIVTVHDPAGRAHPLPTWATALAAEPAGTKP